MTTTRKLSTAQREALIRFRDKPPGHAVTNTPPRTLASLWRRDLILRPFTFDGALRLTCLTTKGEQIARDL